MFQKENLEEKIWYRFLKIVYGFFILVVFLIAAVVFGISKPYEDVENRVIVCDNGITYKSEDYSVDSSYLSSTDKRKIYVLCGGKISVKQTLTGKIIEITDLEQLSDYEYSLSANFDKKNYNIKKTYKTYNSWPEAIQNALTTFFIGIVMIEVIKKTFLYIIIGGNWLKL